MERPRIAIHPSDVTVIPSSRLVTMTTEEFTRSDVLFSRDSDRRRLGVWFEPRPEDHEYDDGEPRRIDYGSTAVLLSALGIAVILSVWAFAF